jgi:hypothetical protein
VSNSAYTPEDSPSLLRSSEDTRPQSLDGVGQTPTPAIGDNVRHRLSGQTGEVVDLHKDPFVKDITHGIVNWTGDGDGFGQGYSSTNLIKF